MIVFFVYNILIFNYKDTKNYRDYQLFKRISYPELRFEGLLTFARTTHLKQVSSFTLGKKQNDFCQVKFNKSGLNFNINAYGGSMVIRFTMDSPFTFNSYSYTLLHIATSSLHAIIDLYHRNLLLFNAATHRYILLRNFERKDVV